MEGGTFPRKAAAFVLSILLITSVLGAMAISGYGPAVDVASAVHGDVDVPDWVMAGADDNNTRSQDTSLHGEDVNNQTLPASPDAKIVQHGNIIYFPNDTEVYAYNIATKEQVWSYTITVPDNFEIFEQQPVVVNPVTVVPSKDMVVVGLSGGDVVQAVDINDGTQMWSTAIGNENGGGEGEEAFGPDDFQGRFVYHENTNQLIFGTEGIETGNSGSRYDPHVFALDADTGAHQWTTYVGEPELSELVMGDIVVFNSTHIALTTEDVNGGNGEVQLLRASDGADVGFISVAGQNTDIWSAGPISYGGDRVVVMDNDNNRIRTVNTTSQSIVNTVSEGSAGGLAYTGDYVIGTHSDGVLSVGVDGLPATADTMRDYPTEIGGDFTEMEFSESGNYLFVIRADGTQLIKYDLADPFDTSPSSVTLNTTVDVNSVTSGTAGNVYGFQFADSGNRLYVVINDESVIYQWNLDAPYQVSGMGSPTTNTSIDGTFSTDVAFSDDGSKMFEMDYSDEEVVEHSLSDPYNVSTNTVENRMSVNADSISIELNDDGSKLFVWRSISSEILYQYNLGTPYDTTTATLESSTDYGAQVDPSEGNYAFEFSDNGGRFHTGMTNAHDLYYVSLTTSYDGDTGIGYKTTGLGGPLGEPLVMNDKVLVQNNTGTGVYLVDYNQDGTLQYDKKIAVETERRVQTRLGATIMAINGSVYGFSGTTLQVIGEFPSAPPTSSSSSDEPLNGSGYTQAFEVVSYDQEYFNTEQTTIQTIYHIGTAPSDSRDWNGQTELENTAEIGAGDRAYIEMRDGGTYNIRVIGQDGNIVDTIFFTGDASDCEDQFSDECLFLIELFGPSGDDGSGGGPGDIEDPGFELPELDTYLQTGIFNFGDQGLCVGLRYWDPNRQTTELFYEFDALNQTYSDTITFDDPVGYYQACLDPLNNPGGGGSEIPDGNVSDLPGGIDFCTTQNESEFCGTLGIGAGGASIQTGGIIAPPESGGGILPFGNFPWILVIVGVLGWVFRDDIRRQINRL